MQSGQAHVIVDYERVVAYHGYRKDNPWDNGGALIIEVPRDTVRDEENRLASKMGKVENHHGWTVEIRDRSNDRSYPVMLRFSDFTLTVWAMPPGWQGIGVPPATPKRQFTAMELCEAFHGDTSGRAWYDERSKDQWTRLAEQLSK